MVDVNEPVEKRASSAVVQENKVVYMQSFSVWSLKQSLKFLTSSQFYLSTLAESVYCTVFFGCSALMMLKDRNLFLNAEMFFFLLSLRLGYEYAALVSVICYTLYFMLLSSYHLTPKLTSRVQNDCEYCMLRVIMTT